MVIKMNNNLEVLSGVVVYNDKPYYYVEQVTGDDGSLIFAYEFSKASLREYNKSKDLKVLAKKSLIKTQRVQRFDSESTDLSKDMSLVKPNEATRQVLVYKPAIFVSPVTDGIDTDTNSYCLGFYEMKPDNYDGPISNQYVEPEMTGIFIGFHHVYWTKEVVDFSKWQGYLEPMYHNYMDYFRYHNG